MLKLSMEEDLPMEVTLTRELEELIDEEVTSGRYPTPGEVIREALRIFKGQTEHRDRQLEALRREVRVGIDELERGEYTEYDEDSLSDLVADIKARGLERSLEA
jgi:antitoxin ParD1/3/4